MADERKIEYEFEDLRRNDDELPPHVLAQLGETPSDYGDEAHAAAARKNDGDGDGGGDGNGHDPDEELIPASEVEKRLARVRREANRNLTQARQEAGETIGKLQKRVDQIESRGEQDELDSEYQKKLDALNAEIDSAVEEGDTKKVTQLTGKLSELTAERVTKAEQLKAKRASEQHDDPEDLNDPKHKPRIIPRARDWLAEQQDWWDDPEHANVKRYVNKLDRALQERGYDPNDDDFYEQLEERIEKKFPGVIMRTMDDEDIDDPDDEFADIPDKRTQTRRRQRTAGRRAPTGERTDKTGGQGGGDGSRRGGGKGKTLSRTQIANMRMFGMDPSNKEHVEAYLQEVK